MKNRITIGVCDNKLRQNKNIYSKDNLICYSNDKLFFNGK